MFDAEQWSAMVFFDPASGKDFSRRNSTTSECSLAATASESSQWRPQNILNRQPVPNHYGPGTPGQKRQKIFDYAEQRCLILNKEAKELKDFQLLIDALGLIKLFDATPGCFERAIESAHGDTPLNQEEDILKIVPLPEHESISFPDTQSIAQ